MDRRASESCSGTDLGEGGPARSRTALVAALEAAAERLRRGLKSVRAELASNASHDESADDNDGGEETANSSTRTTARRTSLPAKGRARRRRSSAGTTSAGTMAFMGAGDGTEDLAGALEMLEEAVAVLRRADRLVSGVAQVAPAICRQSSTRGEGSVEAEAEVVDEVSRITVTKAGSCADGEPTTVAGGASSTSDEHAILDERLSEGDSEEVETDAQVAASPWASPFGAVADDDVAAWLVETYADEYRRHGKAGFDVQLARPASVVSIFPYNRKDSGFASSEGTTSPKTPGMVSDDPAQQTEQDAPDGIAPFSPLGKPGSRTVYERSATRSYPAFCSVRRFREALNSVGSRCIKDINDPDFDIFHLLEERGEDRVFFDVVMNVFCQYNFVRSLQIDLKRFARFVTTLGSCYRPENPYHNAIHAADVLQTTHVYMCVGDVKENFSDVELLAVLFSAIIHDAGHVGVNNNFLVKTRHPLALVFNDTSPLESMHVSLALHVLETAECNFFIESKTWSQEHYADFRQLVVETVMGTDMRHHTDLITVVKEILDDGKVEDNEVSKLFKSIVHAADMSNPMKPPHIYKRWIERVIAEFWQQGDEERRRGLPISMMCDRKTANVAKGQIGFIDFVVKPYMRELESVLPPVWMERLAENRRVMEGFVGQEDPELRARIEAFSASPWRDVGHGDATSYFLWATLNAEPGEREERCGLLGPWLRPSECIDLVQRLSIMLQLLEVERDAEWGSVEDRVAQASQRWIRELVEVTRSRSESARVVADFVLACAAAAGVDADSLDSLLVSSPADCSEVVATIAEDGCDVAVQLFGENATPATAGSFLNTVMFGAPDSGSFSPRERFGRAISRRVHGTGSSHSGTSTASACALTPVISFAEPPPPPPPPPPPAVQDDASSGEGGIARAAQPHISAAGPTAREAVAGARLRTAELVVALTRAWAHAAHRERRPPRVIPSVSTGVQVGGALSCSSGPATAGRQRCLAPITPGARMTAVGIFAEVASDARLLQRQPAAGSPAQGATFDMSASYATRTRRLDARILPPLWRDALFASSRRAVEGSESGTSRDRAHEPRRDP